MQISLFSIIASVAWCTIFMIVYLLFTKVDRYYTSTGIRSIGFLLLFFIIRMVVPLELPWTITVGLPSVLNPIYLFLFKYPIFTFIQKDVYPADILIAVWLTGTCGCLATSAIRCLKLKRILQVLHPDSIDGVAVVKSNAIRSPLIYGIHHPIILFPNKEYDDKFFRYALFHEKAHIENKDVLLKLLLEIFTAIFWWNPIAYVLSREMRRFMEIRCDIQIVSRLPREEAADYMEALVDNYVEKNLLGDDDKASEAFERRIYTAANYLKNGYTYSWRMWMGIIISLMLGIISYAFVFHSSFPTPRSEIYDKDGIIEITPEIGWIEYDRDTDTYYMVDGYAPPSVISKEIAFEFIDEGYRLETR